MRNRKVDRKFGRETAQRKALINSLMRALVINGKITTTEAKAKELSKKIEKEITTAKAGDINARRKLAERFSEDLVKKMVEEIAPKYVERKGGYTRVIKLGQRKSDAADMAVIELV
jgi:large subunit ribosomal protein L17